MTKPKVRLPVEKVHAEAAAMRREVDQTGPAYVCEQGHPAPISREEFATLHRGNRTVHCVTCLAPVHANR